MLKNNQKGFAVPFLYIALVMLGLIGLVIGGFAVVIKLGLYSVVSWVIGWLGIGLLGKAGSKTKKFSKG